MVFQFFSHIRSNLFKKLNTIVENNYVIGGADGKPRDHAVDDVTTTQHRQYASGLFLRSFLKMSLIFLKIKFFNSISAVMKLIIVIIIAMKGSNSPLQLLFLCCGFHINSLGHKTFKLYCNFTVSANLYCSAGLLVMVTTG